MQKLAFFCWLIPFVTLAQKEQQNWLFGSYLGMQFTGSGITVIPAGTSAMYSPYASSCYSDPSTGDLRFYTSGSFVYNRNHVQMPGGDRINDDALAIHCCIVPDPASANRFYIFSSAQKNTTLYATLVDMNLNNGLGGIVYKAMPVTAQADKAFTIVRDVYDGGYWLITHVYGTGRFLCFRIGKNGIEAGISSAAGPVMPGGTGMDYIRGKMTANSSGAQFVYTDGTLQEYHLLVFSFDKRCGLVSLKHELYPDIIQAQQTLAYAAFSPNNQFLYATWFHNSGQTFLYQYDLGQPDPNGARTTLHAQSLVVGDLQLAPNGKICLAAAENGAVTSKINVIENPDLAGAACGFSLYRHTLSVNPVHFTEHFPEQVNDVEPQQIGYGKPRIRFENTCEGVPVSFSLADPFTADSFRWYFGDGSSSAEPAPVHQYASVTDYVVRFRWFLCNREYELTDTVKLRRNPQVNLGPDTTICTGETLLLQAPPGADEYLWNTGARASFITADTPGIYKLTVRSGQCRGEDEVRISFYPPLQVLLGRDLYICENDRELVKLDAGEGFVRYRWTPTGDTTQWIMVAEAGEYFVVVNDFRGCAGKDGTLVKRRCPVSVYFPDIFTPNRDGINDTYLPRGNEIESFRMIIYNRWGEPVFETENTGSGWDGTVNGRNAPDGVYVYLAGYSGYVNKQLRWFQKKGTVSLLR